MMKGLSLPASLNVQNSIILSSFFNIDIPFKLCTDIFLYFFIFQSKEVMRMISKQTRTFTDVFCLSLDWRVTVMKLLSVDPANYCQA